MTTYLYKIPWVMVNLSTWWATYSSSSGRFADAILGCSASVQSRLTSSLSMLPVHTWRFHIAFAISSKGIHIRKKLFDWKTRSANNFNIFTESIKKTLFSAACNFRTPYSEFYLMFSRFRCGHINRGRSRSSRSLDNMKKERKLQQRKKLFCKNKMILHTWNITIGFLTKYWCSIPLLCTFSESCNKHRLTVLFPSGCYNR